MNWIINFYDILIKSKEIMDDFSYTTVDERKQAYEIYKIAFNALLKSKVAHIFNDDFTQLNINGNVFILKNDSDESFLEDKESVSSYNNYIKSQEDKEEDYDELTQEDSLINNNQDEPSNSEDDTNNNFVDDTSPEEFPLVDDESENESDFEDEVMIDNEEEIFNNNKSSSENNDNESQSYEEYSDSDSYEEPSFNESFDDNTNEDFNPPSFEVFDEPNFEPEVEEVEDIEDIKEVDNVEEIPTHDVEEDFDDDLEVNIDESQLDYPEYPSFMHYKDFTLSKSFISINLGENVEPMKLIMMLVPLRNDVERPDYMFAVFKEGETELNVVENTDNPFVYSIFENDAQYDIVIDLKIENSKVLVDIKVAKFTLEESRYLILGEEYEVKMKENFGNGDKGHVVLYDDTKTKRIHIAPVQENNGKFGRANLIFYIESLIDDDENFIGDTSKARNADGTYKPSFQLGNDLYSINSKYKDGVLYSMIDKY